MATAPKPQRGKAAKASEPVAEQGAAGALPADQQGAGSGSPLAVSGDAQGQQQDQQGMEQGKQLDEQLDEQQGGAPTLDAGAAVGGEQQGETGSADGVTPPESVAPGAGEQPHPSQDDQQDDDEEPSQEVAPAGPWEMPEVKAFPVPLQFRNATGEPVSFVPGLDQPLAPGAEAVVKVGERAYRKLKSLLPALAKVRGWNNQFGVLVNDDCED